MRISARITAAAFASMTGVASFPGSGCVGGGGGEEDGVDAGAAAVDSFVVNFVSSLSFRLFLSLFLAPCFIV